MLWNPSHSHAQKARTRKHVHMPPPPLARSLTHLHMHTAHQTFPSVWGDLSAFRILLPTHSPLVSVFLNGHRWIRPSQAPCPGSSSSPRPPPALSLTGGDRRPHTHGWGAPPRQPHRPRRGAAGPPPPPSCRPRSGPSGVDDLPPRGQSWEFGKR